MRGKSFGTTVLSGSAYALPLETGAFDAVVMSEVLEHLENPVEALSEAARVLQPGGALLATVPNANYPFFWDPINWTLERTIGKPIRRGTFAGIWANHVRLYTGPDLRSHLEAAGFEMQQLVFQTHAAMPFVHNIVYGIGKPLLERRLLPTSWAKSAERAGGRGTRKGINPVATGIRVIQWFDRHNSDSELASRSSLNICALATKR
jgi:2-polyprenyl-6-hydroxyphenyl methylase / 3-demethylubiquinone-9 3-methyltransferase